MFLLGSRELWITNLNSNFSLIYYHCVGVHATYVSSLYVTLGECSAWVFHHSTYHCFPHGDKLIILQFYLHVCVWCAFFHFELGEFISHETSSLISQGCQLPRNETLAWTMPSLSLVPQSSECSAHITWIFMYVLPEAILQELQCLQKLYHVSGHPI